MNKIKWLLVLSILLSGHTIYAQKKFSTNSFSLVVGARGTITHINALPDGEELAAKDSQGILLQLVKGDKRYAPDSASFNKDVITLYYADRYIAKVKAGNKPGYLRFELSEVSSDIDAVIWGPFNTSLSDTIGSFVGVVRSPAFAVGIQSLNTKTTGGLLKNEEGAVYDRGTTATKQSFGSSLQAFTINRSRARSMTVWNNWKNVPVGGIADGKMEGSAIAFFACKNSGVLSVISAVEKAEGLPHPLWKNEWIRQSEFPGHPYMISSFSEESIDTVLQYAKSMGLDGVYHEGPFSTWGNFELDKKMFPHGREGFKQCVDKAHALGLRLGFHTLTNFITTNDPYVTPKPNAHLATAGGSVIREDIGMDDTEIPVQSSEYFAMRSDLNSVRIGDEIIRFREVSPASPYKLLGCVRGAYGTQRSAHKSGDAIGRLIDHPYKVFFPDWILEKEISGNIARFLNETGADQMDFDGHEGTYATGMGNLAMETFADDVYKALKHPVIFGSSRSAHFFWHMNDYLNWGEPWYGGFRESQSDYRINNQKFYEANYLPNMLGWLLITAQTRPEDVDWMLARAAGYNAGYALVVRLNAARNNPRIQEVIAAINSWTKAQQSRAFSPAQREWLRDTAYDAHLEKTVSGSWNIYRYKNVVFEHQARVLQPGQPTSSEWPFENKAGKQAAQVVLLAAGKSGEISHPVIELDNSFRVEVPVTLEAGESLVIDSSTTAALYNQNGKFIKNIELERGLPSLEQGEHRLLFDCLFSDNTDIGVRIKIKLLESVEEVPANK